MEGNVDLRQGLDDDVDLESPFESTSSRSGGKRKGFTMESILQQRQKRRDLQDKVREKTKALLGKRRGADDANVENQTSNLSERRVRRGATAGNSSRRYDGGVSQMCAMANTVSMAIGEVEEEDPEPEYFSSAFEATRTNKPDLDGKNLSSVDAFIGECSKACERYGLKREECGGDMLDEIVSGGWLSDFHSQSTEGWPSQTVRWLCDTSRRCRDSNLALHATKALCNVSASHRSLSFSSAVGYIDACSNSGQGMHSKGEDTFNAAFHMKHVKAFIEAADFSSKASDSQAIKLLNSLFRLAEGKGLAIIYDLVIHCIALTLCRWTAASRTTKNLDISDLLSEECGQDRLETAPLAFSRVLRDVFFRLERTVGESSKSAMQVAKKLLEQHTLACLRKISRETAKINSSSQFILDCVPDPLKCISGAMEGNGGGLWGLHDAMKLVDILLWLSHGSSDSNWVDAAQEKLMPFLNSLLKKTRKVNKESSRSVRVLASELSTTYEWLLRCNRMRTAAAV